MKKYNTILFSLLFITVSCTDKNQTGNAKMPLNTDANIGVEIIDEISEDNRYNKFIKLNNYIDSIQVEKIKSISFSEMKDEDIQILLNEKTFDFKQREILGKIDGLNLKVFYHFDDQDSVYIRPKINRISIANSDKVIYSMLLGSTASWENDFFILAEGRKAWTVIGPINNFHRYGEKINCFYTDTGDLIMFFIENFGSGSGIWQFNYFFYKISLADKTIEPSLNCLTRSNQQWPHYRNFMYDSELISTNPLSFVVTMANTIRYSDSTNCDIQSYPLDVYTDTFEITYIWNQELDTFLLTDEFKVTREQSESYYITDISDIQFIRQYKDYLLRIIQDNPKSDTSCIITSYLEDVKKWVDENE